MHLPSVNKIQNNGLYVGALLTITLTFVHFNNDILHEILFSQYINCINYFFYKIILFLF